MIEDLKKDNEIMMKKIEKKTSKEVEDDSWEEVE